LVRAWVRVSVIITPLNNNRVRVRFRVSLLLSLLKPSSFIAINIYSLIAFSNPLIRVRLRVRITPLKLVRVRVWVRAGVRVGFNLIHNHNLIFIITYISLIIICAG
jgi:hypothetical protein